LAAIAFEIAKRIFVVFVANFPTYTVIYGALAAVPIFLVWIYVSWLVVLLGAVFTAALPIVKYERWWHVAVPGSAFVDAMEVLKVLYQARDNAANAGVESATIRAATRLGLEEMETLLEKMLAVGWVARIKPEKPRRAQWGKRIVEGLDTWVLLANPHQLRVADVYRIFAFQPSGNAVLAEQVERVMEQGLNQPIGTHFTDQPALARAS
jgi:membrane protein